MLQLSRFRADWSIENDEGKLRKKRKRKEKEKKSEAQ